MVVVYVDNTRMRASLRRLYLLPPTYSLSHTAHGPRGPRTTLSPESTPHSPQCTEDRAAGLSGSAWLLHMLPRPIHAVGAPEVDRRQALPPAAPNATWLELGLGLGLGLGSGLGQVWGEDKR